LKFNIKVRNTGASKDVAGLSAKESIMTMTVDATDQKSGQTGSLAITTDMYLAPDIPGYDEVRDFDRRYAIKMGTVINGAINPQMMAMMQQPAAGKGMADMVEEMSKLKGIPVLQIMRMGTTIDGTPLPAASEAPLPVGPPPPSAGDIAKQSASSAIMSSLPFGGFGKKKKQEAPPPATDAAQPTADDCRLLHTRRRHRSVFGEHNGKRRSSALSIHIGPDPDRTAVLIDELLAHP
jgi:hypothetical protein